MKDPIKILLSVIVVVTLANIGISIWGNSNIREIKKDIKAAQKLTDSAIMELDKSRQKIDSIKADIVVFTAYISYVQKSVELNDAEKRIRDEMDAEKVRDLKNRIKELRRDIETDSLPDVGTLTMKKPD
jgi:SMC interacting uncharacterized protein involved in chromosome segregation